MRPGRGVTKFGLGLALGWSDWTPTYGGTGSMTYTSVTTQKAKYKVDNGRVYFVLRAFGTTGGTADVTITASLPYGSGPSQPHAIGCAIRDAASGDTFQDGVAFVNSTDINFQLPGATNWSLGANRYITASGVYEAV